MNDDACARYYVCVNCHSSFVLNMLLKSSVHVHKISERDYEMDVKQIVDMLNASHLHPRAVIPGNNVTIKI